MLIESTNMLLLWQACALPTNNLCNHIQSHIHPDTMTASTTAKLQLVTDYKYKHTLKVLDDAWVHVNELLKAVVKQMMSSLLNTNNTFNKCWSGGKQAESPQRAKGKAWRCCMARQDKKRCSTYNGRTLIYQEGTPGTRGGPKALLHSPPPPPPLPQMVMSTSPLVETSRKTSCENPF